MQLPIEQQIYQKVVVIRFLAARISRRLRRRSAASPSVSEALSNALEIEPSPAGRTGFGRHARAFHSL